MQFIEGDIDRPLITGGVYNGPQTPPFSAGEDAGVNHPGMLAGWHSRGLDGAGHNRWVVDDAPGRLRTRLSTSYAGSEIGLGHLISQSASSAQCGTWRSSGFDESPRGDSYSSPGAPPCQSGCDRFGHHRRINGARGTDKAGSSTK